MWQLLASWDYCLQRQGKEGGESDCEEGEGGAGAHPAGSTVSGEGEGGGGSGEWGGMRGGPGMLPVQHRTV